MKLSGYTFAHGSSSSGKRKEGEVLCHAVNLLRAPGGGGEKEKREVDDRLKSGDFPSPR